MLDVFMDKWDIVNHDIEAWRKRPAEGKTYLWFYERIKQRIEEWRAEQNHQYMEDWARHLSARGGPQP